MACTRRAAALNDPLLAGRSLANLQAVANEVAQQAGMSLVDFEAFVHDLREDFEERDRICNLFGHPCGEARIGAWALSDVR